MKVSAGEVAITAALAGDNALPTQADALTLEQPFLDEVDRIFNGDDVVFTVAVGHIDDRCQSRGFSTAGRTRDQHQASGQGRQF